MTVVSMVVGAPSTSGVTVKTKVSSGSNVRLAVSTNSGMTSPTYFGPITPDAQNVAPVSATGLSAFTQYWWQIEHGGVLDTTYTGKFKTLPSAYPMSYIIATGSCAGTSPIVPGEGAVLASTRLSNHPVFDYVRARSPLMLVHLGDLHYYDLSSGQHGIAGGASLSNFRRAYDDVLLQSKQHQLLREVPFTYTFDDHCFIGNDKRGTEDTTSAANALTVYKERVPHFTLPNPTDGCYQAWTIGRTQFILLDCRSKASANSATDNASKTMLGSTQKTWLEGVLDTSTSEALVIFSSSQWTHTTHTDSWNVFNTERTEIMGLFDEYGWSDRMCMVWGDRHSSLLTTGANNSHGGFPGMMVSGFDSSPSGLTPGPYQEATGRGQYGTVQIDDTGSGGVSITLSAWQRNRVTMRYTFNTAGQTVIPATSPDHVLGR